MQAQAMELKRQICEKARALGANLVRSCPAARWAEHPIQPPDFWPQNIWPWVQNVVVLGIPLYAPMMAASPSMVYQELYDTSNRVLDDMAYRLTNFIATELGFRALYFPRDCYYSIETLLDRVFPCAGGVLRGDGDDRGQPQPAYQGVRPAAAHGLHPDRRAACGG